MDNNTVEFSEDLDNPTNFSLIIACTYLNDISTDNFPVLVGYLESFTWFS